MKKFFFCSMEHLQSCHKASRAAVTLTSAAFAGLVYLNWVVLSSIELCHVPASRRPQLMSLKKGWFLSSSQSLFLKPSRFTGSFSISPSQMALLSLLNLAVYATGSFRILRATSLFSTLRERKAIHVHAGSRQMDEFAGCLMRQLHTVPFLLAL